ncbi:MAG: outer membrane protein transport protein [Gallionella sp.]|nr:outer membrane protein transport protein [Gallionella sp.]MDD4959753.1 outer membrane protein transport protein [Gallionella sp.]
MNQKKIVLSILAAAMLSPLIANATNGYFSHGYGIKAKGMGGAGIALPQDSLAAATNPAGMVKVGDRIDLGVDLFVPNRGADVTGAAANTYSGNGKSNFLIPEFGYNKMMGSDMSLGVAVYGNGGMNTTYASSPFGPNAGINLEQLFIAPTWAMKINPQHSIGVSLNLVYQTFSATGLAAFAPMSSNAAALTNTGTDSSTGIGLRLGWTGEITPEFTMGATYQPKTKMGKFNKYAGLFAEQGGFDIPASYGIGFAYKMMPSTTMAFDIEKIDYGNVASIANSNAAGGALGMNNGAGFGWQNMTVYKLGVSHAWNDAWTVRAGYNHNNAQIPNTQTLFNVLAPGVVQDHLTLGATWNVSKDNELSFSYMHAFKQTVSGTAGTAGMVGGTAANINMYQDALGVAYSWKL